MKPAMTIVGGGLVGCLWAVLLKKRGYKVCLYERRSDIRKTPPKDDRSINLVVTSRGLNGLHKAGLLDEALSLSVPIFGRKIHAKSGELSYQAYGKDNECNFSISRTELNKFLLSAAELAGVDLFFDHPLESIDFAGRTLNFENGERAGYEVLFGTDGSGSRVRKALCDRFPGEFQETIQWLEADYKELHLPAGPGGKPLVERNALHIWPRGSHMMMALANLDGSFTVTLYMPRSGPAVNFELVKTEGEVRALFCSEFPDAIPLMPGFTDDFLKNPQSRLGTVRCTRWIYQDSVALMGDAAHAIVPFFGQGMNCGFEDCTNFLKILDETQDHWPRTLLSYQEIQKPNADAIADMAIENWTEMRDRVGDARFLLRKKVEALLEREFPELYKSRYGMVTYTLIPYATAQAAGQIQDRILSALCEGISAPEQVDLGQARALLQSDFSPFVTKNHLVLGTDPLVSESRRRFQI